MNYRELPKCVKDIPLDYDELRDYDGNILWVRLKHKAATGLNEGWALCDLDRSSLIQGWYGDELYFDEYGYTYVAYPIKDECLA